jgi:DNA-binding transcriptional MerR regulator
MQTLRRWAKNGSLRPSYVSPGKHRYYAEDSLRQFTADLYVLANAWAHAEVNVLPSAEDAHCPTSSTFQARLATFESALRNIPDLKSRDRFSLIVSIIGEIGDNAFAHNLGRWPDVPGVYFSYDANRRHVVVADRGVGVLATLRQVRPNLHDDKEALTVAFTERLSGRAPENRGNGLKYVRAVIAQNAFTLSFQSGNAVLHLRGGSPDLHLEPTDTPIRGTLAFLTF